MIQIKMYGTGGHGVVVAAKILSDTAVTCGLIAQSFSSYGAERRGGKVEGYVRLSEKHIFLHCKMYDPDFIVLMDENFVKDPEVLAGLKNDGLILINSTKPPEYFSVPGGFNISTINAAHIAQKHQLVLPNKLPIINTVMLGSIVAMIPLLNFESLATVIRKGNIPKPEKNIEAAREAYEKLKLPLMDSDIGEKIEDNVRIDSGRYPAFLYEKCNLCGNCYMFCPDIAIIPDSDRSSFIIRDEFCKGCGICIEECPKKAMEWKERHNA
ncbi:MAG: 2-oxoacid:acceptor oxidoreductase family protein [Proteobacteria bacterium]|nr:2-oxoacid:acceptor oxidoreductase family protein [Pseudomonadota bacterium]